MPAMLLRSFRLPEYVALWVAEKAKKERRSCSQIIVFALEDAMQADQASRRDATPSDNGMAVQHAE